MLSDRRKQALVEHARSWIGTKFHPYGRVKKSDGNEGGVDCLGFVLGLLDEAGNGTNMRNSDSTPKLFQDLSPDWYPYGLKSNIFFDECSKALRFISKDSADIDIGDFVLFDLFGYPGHIAFVPQLTPMHMIHVLTHYHVAEHRMDAPWEKRFHSVFRARE